MQEPVSELAGRAQLVKSARICELTLLLVVPQSSGVAAISCSLVAYSACGHQLIWSESIGQRYARRCRRKEDGTRPRTGRTSQLSSVQ